MERSISRRLTSHTLFPLIAFLLPPLAVFAPLGVAALFTVAALGTLIALVLTAPARFRVIADCRSLAALLAALGLWATASALWSILPAHSFLEGLRLLALSAGGLVIIAAALSATEEERARFGSALLAGLALALLLLAVERFGHEPITRLALGIPPETYLNPSRFDRGITVLVLAMWPALFAVNRPSMRLLIIAATLAMAVAMVSAAALLAAVTSLAVFAIAYVAPRFIAGTMIAAILVLGAAIPLATPRYEAVVALHEQAPWIKWSGLHRLVIWRFAADRVAERPIIGWGMDSARGIPGGKTDLSALVPALHYPGGAEALPLHPHDAALQIELELGLPGLCLALAIIVWVLWRIGWRAPLGRAQRAGGLALAAATLTVGLLSFGIWQAWWLSTLWLISTFFTGATAINSD